MLQSLMFRYNIFSMMVFKTGPGGGDFLLKVKKRQRLVPLNVMVAPDDLEFIKAQTYGTGDSMGRVVRQLIEANRKLQIAISKATKGEEK